MLVGFFLVIPVLATILIFNFVFTLATGWLPGSFFPPAFRDFLKGYPLRIVALLLVFLVFYTAGLLTRNFFGRHLYRMSDKLLTRIPFIKGIYISIRQITESLFTQRNTLFKEVVIVEYPRKGLYSLAFVTAQVPARVSSAIQTGNNDCISLFIPTTPNPTSGILILVPRAEVSPLNIPISDALTFIMSAGAVGLGEDGGLDRPTLLDKLELWLKRGDHTPA